MPVQLIRPDGLPDVPYAYAARAPGHDLLFTAGACPLDAGGEVAAPGSYAGQARVVMENLDTVLAAAGAGLADVARTTVYVASAHRPDLVEAWEAVRTAFGAHDPPSTLVGVTVLGYPGQLVEVEAVAVLPAAGS